MKGNTVAYDNSNKGALFQARDKKTENHPDYDGTINIDGQEYWLSGWKRTSAKGTTFLSLSAKPKQVPETAKRQDAAKARHIPAKSGSGFDDMDSDVPF
jgi:uncharacterized protein (DUF736 family)